MTDSKNDEKAGDRSEEGIESVTDKDQSTVEPEQESSPTQDEVGVNKQPETSQEQGDQASSEPSLAHESSTPTPELDKPAEDLSARQLPPVIPTAVAEPRAAEPKVAPALQKPPKRWPLVVVFLLVVILFAGAGTAGWWLYPQWQSRADELADLNTQLERERAALVALEQRLAQVDASSTKVRQDIGASQQQQSKQLQAMTERLNAHNQRLLSLSNTSREDWQLAEAHYLLRLASQRLLVDRSATSALGLMEATDDILRDLNMPDLFPVREALAQDLGAVRLAAEIDREGVFLRLQGLIDNIDRLPLFATPELPEPEPVAAFVAADEDDIWTKTWGWTKHAGRSLLVELRKYFAVRQHDQVEPPMLPPTASEYLRQNVRFNLEQAQVALLREQQIVYRESLAQTGQLLDRYFPDSANAQALQKELVHLSNQDIQSQLPSISGSLAQLQAYIERLHRLAPREVSEPES